MNAKHSEKKLARAIAMSVLVAIFGALTISESAAATPDPGITRNTVVIIPNNAYYQYSLVGVNLPGGTFSGNGNAPFGSDPGIFSSGRCPLQKTVNTIWPTGPTSLTLRKQFVLPAGATNLRVQLSIDNDATVFINGNRVAQMVMHEDCPLVDEFLVPVPNSFLNSPPVSANIGGAINTITVEATDTGGGPNDETFIDLRVLVDVP
jgi:hypothetical protein